MSGLTKKIKVHLYSTNPLGLPPGYYKLLIIMTLSMDFQKKTPLDTTPSNWRSVLKSYYARIQGAALELLQMNSKVNAKNLLLQTSEEPLSTRQ